MNEIAHVEDRRCARSRALLGAFVVALFTAVAHAQQAPASVDGTWHIAIPGWGIEDHLLVVEQEGGAIAGKFEFADVAGTVVDTTIAFDVTDNGKIILHFQGVVSGDSMKGAVTSPKDGPLAHLVPEGQDATTVWTALREANSR